MILKFKDDETSDPIGNSFQNLFESFSFLFVQMDNLCRFFRNFSIATNPPLPYDILDFK